MTRSNINRARGQKHSERCDADSKKTFRTDYRKMNLSITTAGLTVEAAAVAILVFFYWTVLYPDLLRLVSRYVQSTGWDTGQVGSLLRCFALSVMQAGNVPSAAAVVLALASFAAFWGLTSLRPRTICAITLNAAAVFLLSAMVTLQGYYLFGVTPMDHYFGYFFGFAAGALLVRFVPPAIKRDRTRQTAEVLTVFLLYPLLGGFALLTGLGFAGLEYVGRKTDDVGPVSNESATCEPTKRCGIWPSGWVILAVSALTPWVWYPIFSGRISLTQIYFEGLRRISIVEPSERITFWSNLYFTSALLIFALPILWPSIQKLFFSGRSPTLRKGIEKSEKPVNGLFTAGDFVTLGLIFVCGAVLCFSDRDKNFLATAAMIKPLENDDWEKILDIESRCPAPTQPLIELRRLALFETGRLAEEVFDRPNGPVHTPELLAITSFRIFGDELLLRYGCVNYAAWTAMNELVISPDSPHYVKILFQTALCSGEYNLAERYLVFLEKSPDKHFAYTIGRESLEALRGGHKPNRSETIAFVERILKYRNRMPQKDYGGYDTLSGAILNASRYRDPAQLSFTEVEMQMVHYLLLGQPELFHQAFPNYNRLRANPSAPLPRAIQQGALVTEGAAVRGLCDPTLLRRFAEYERCMSLYRSYPQQSAEFEKSIRRNFSDTWWFYFHTLSQMKIY